MILSISLLILLGLQFASIMMFNYDFHYVNKNKFFSYDSTIFVIDFFFVTGITLIKHIPSFLGDNPFTGLRVSNESYEQIFTSYKPIKIM